LRLPVPGHAGAGVWLLLRHADVQRVLRDPGFSVDRRRADVVRENAERLPLELIGEEGGLRSMYANACRSSGEPDSRSHCAIMRTSRINRSPLSVPLLAIATMPAPARRPARPR